MALDIKGRLRTWLLSDGEKQEPPTTTTGGVVVSTGTQASYTPKTTRNVANLGYMQNVTVYRAVNIVAQACASVDWVVYKVGSGKKPKRVQLYDHPLHKLLSNPNPDKARSSFIEQLVSYWLITGTNYMLASFLPGERLPLASPVGLYNLRPDLITLRTNATGNVSYYRYDTGEGYIDYPAWKVMPLRFFHPLDELAGLSPIQVAATVVERQNAGEEWNFQLMKNMARPSGAFVAATEFSDEGRARLKREVVNKYGRGKQTAGMPLLLENGLTYVQLAINPVDADWFNSDAGAGRKISAAIGVDPLLLNDKQYSTYNNELEAKLAMWELTCFPMMEKLKDEFNAFLVPFYGDGVAVDYNREPIESLKKNRQLESMTTVAEWNVGLRSFNDSAADLGVEGIEEMDDFYRFGPMLFVRKSNVKIFLDMQEMTWQQTQPQLPQGRTIVSPVMAGTHVNLNPPNAVPMLHEPSPAKAIQEENRRIYQQIERHREEWYGHVKQGVIQYFQAELQIVLQAMAGHRSLKTVRQYALAAQQLHTQQLQNLFAQYYASIAEEAARRIGVQFGTKCSIFTKQNVATLGRYAGASISRISDTTQRNIEEIFVDGIAQEKTVEAVMQELRDLYQGYQGNRAELIAVNETVLANNIGSHVAAAQLGIPLYKTWLTAGDSKVRDDHADSEGQRVYFEEPYSVGGSKMMFPKDDSMGASIEEIINCRCTETYTQDFNPENNPYYQQQTGILPDDFKVSPEDFIKALDDNGQRFGSTFNNTYKITVDGQDYFLKNYNVTFQGTTSPDAIRAPDQQTREQVARDASKLLGVDQYTVPLVTFKDPSGEKYVVQEWHNRYITYDMNSTAFERAISKLSDYEATKIALFEYTTGDQDHTTNGGNYALDERGNIKLLDYSLSYPEHAGMGREDTLFYDAMYGLYDKQLDKQALLEIVQQYDTYLELAKKDGLDERKIDGLRQRLYVLDELSKKPNPTWEDLDDVIYQLSGGTE